MSAFDHDRATCTREHCGRCRQSGEPHPPKPVDHQVQAARKPQGRRELDLGRLVQKVGRRIEDEGQAVSQQFYKWEEVGTIPPTPPACPVCDGVGCRDCNGTGDARPAFDGVLKQQQERRAASRLRRQWLDARVQMEALCNRMDWLMDQAQAVSSQLESKHRTAAQVETDGFCGNCWAKVGVLVEVTLRPSGEPWYRGRCRGCGSYRGENGVEAPADVVALRLRGREPAGKKVRVKAS